MERQINVQKEIVQMRELGKQIYNAVSRGADLKLPVEVLRTGADITQSPNFKFLIGEEIKYSAKNPFTGGSVEETWMRVMKGFGVTVLPLIEYEGEKSPIFIFKPQPSVESWSIELVSGGVRGVNTAETAAIIELQGETGLKAEKITKIPQLTTVWHAPHRLDTVDTMVIAENLTFVGRNSEEKEEAPISPFIATWKETIAYLQNNVIKYAASIATLTTYLLFYAPEEVLKEVKRD